MTDQESNILYTEALNAAEREATDLEQEISQLRKMLLQLETHKVAVDQVCIALGRWVDIAAARSAGPSDPLDPIFEEHGGTIRLSEEEVSLIAYPDGPPEEEAG